jgi:cytochrome P450/NADPH-cytochrome P450 reductase
VYGEIFRLDLAGRKTVVCSSYETVNDLCDWSRFEKPVQGALEELRALIGDGLFSSYPGEKNWGVAHRILMPVFGPMGIRKVCIKEAIVYICILSYLDHNRCGMA